MKQDEINGACAGDCNWTDGGHRGEVKKVRVTHTKNGEEVEWEGNYCEGAIAHDRNIDGVEVEVLS